MLVYPFKAMVLMGKIHLICRAIFDGLSNLGVDRNADIEKIKILQLTNIFSFIIVFYMTVFGITVLSAGNTHLGFFDLGMGMLTLLNVLFLKWHRRVNLAADIVVVLMTIVMLFLVGGGGWYGLGIIWIVLYPLLVLPLTGVKKGSLYTITLLAAVILLYLFRNDLGLYNYGSKNPVADILFKRIVFIYLGVFIVSFSFVRNRHALYEEIKRLSLTDALTFLPNRRSINNMLEHQARLFQRRHYASGKHDAGEVHTPFSCLLCDIDGFKSINDSHGHLNGDIVLKVFGACLRSNLRGSDFVGRWGGEEFLIILEETDLERAKHVALKLVESIRGHSFELQDRSMITLTMSCGAACYDKKQNMEDFLKELDNNLYLAKRMGKDRIAAAGEIFQ